MGMENLKMEKSYGIYESGWHGIVCKGGVPTVLEFLGIGLHGYVMKVRMQR